MIARWLTLAVLAVLVAAGVAGCDGDTEVDDDVADDDSAFEGCGNVEPVDCNRYDTLGMFQVRVTDEGLDIEGAYASNADPNTPYRLVEEGDCAFFQLDPPPFCDPPCQAPLVCGYGDACRPELNRLDVGRVTVTGSPVPAALSAQGVYYGEAPFVEPGTRIVLDAEGGSGVSPFHLCAAVPEQIVASPSYLDLVPGQDAQVAWEPAGEVDDAHIYLRLVLNYHAGYGFIECTADDASGSLTIPASVVDAFITSNLTGFNNWFDEAWIARRDVDTVETSLGCAELRVFTWQNIHLDIVETPPGR
jgi:hypothetical protein